MRLDIPGLLGAISGLPTAINKGLLGPLPVNPGMGLDPNQVRQAQDTALNDLAFGMLAGNRRNPGASLFAARQNAREGFSSRVFDMFKEQEISRMQADRAKQQQQFDAYRATLPPEIQPVADVAGLQSTAQKEIDAAFSQGGATGPGWGNINPGDYTPQSLAVFARTKKFEDLVRWTTPPQDKIVVIGGVPHAYQNGGVVPLSSLDQEAQAREILSSASAQGQGAGQYASEAPKRDEQRRLAYTTISNTRDAIDKAMALVGPLTTGIGGAVTGQIPGTQAMDLKKQIDTIKANLGFAELSAMRQASPTGGALGQVAVQELTMLQSTVASLDTIQSEKALREALLKAKQHMSNWEAAVNKAAAADSKAAPDPLGIR